MKKEHKPQPSRQRVTGRSFCVLRFSPPAPLSFRFTHNGTSEKKAEPFKSNPAPRATGQRKWTRRRRWQRCSARRRRKRSQWRSQRECRWWCRWPCRGRCARGRRHGQWMCRLLHVAGLWEGPDFRCTIGQLSFRSFAPQHRNFRESFA